MKIGVLSDTHGYIYPSILGFLSECEEIWHCGDIGSEDVMEKLNKITSVKYVSGNIDEYSVSKKYPDNSILTSGESKILLMHNAGYPEKYSPKAKKLLLSEKPNILVCGHTHILRVMYDHVHQCFYINPGAAGRFGFHTHYTAIRFELEKGIPVKMEVFETERSATSTSDFS